MFFQNASFAAENTKILKLETTLQIINRTDASLRMASKTRTAEADNIKIKENMKKMASAIAENGNSRDFQRLEKLVLNNEALVCFLPEVKSAIAGRSINEKSEKETLARLTAVEGICQMAGTGRHYDSTHPGHFHECPECGYMFHEPGDEYQGSAGYTKCPKCGHEMNANPDNHGGHDNHGHGSHYDTYDQGVRFGEKAGYRDGYDDGWAEDNEKPRYYPNGYPGDSTSEFQGGYIKGYKSSYKRGFDKGLSDLHNS